MDLEVVSTINGRKATRAKAWRICETGVTYFDPGLAVSRPAARRSRARLSVEEQLVLKTLRACGRAPMMRIRESMLVRPSPQDMTRILTRLVTLGLVIERHAATRGPTNRSTTYEAIHDPGD